MKKTIIFFLLFSAVQVQAQIDFFCGAEYNPCNSIKLEKTFDTFYMGSVKQSIRKDLGEFDFAYGVKKSYKGLTAKIMATTYFSSVTFDSFRPVWSDYGISLSYKIKKIRFEVSHNCYHPVICDKNYSNVKLFGARTKIGIYYNM